MGTLSKTVEEVSLRNKPKSECHRPPKTAVSGRESATVRFPIDIQAFTMIYRQYYPALCDFAYWYTEDPDTSKDIVQEVFLNIWKNNEIINFVGSIRSYLYISVKNRSLNLIKHKKLERNWADHCYHTASRQSYTPEDHMLEFELSDKINKVLNRLPAQRKRIFMLSRDHELSYREIADVLDISIKTVETQISRSLNTIRQELKEYL